MTIGVKVVPQQKVLLATGLEVGLDPRHMSFPKSLEYGHSFYEETRLYLDLIKCSGPSDRDGINL